MSKRRESAPTAPILAVLTSACTPNMFVVCSLPASPTITRFITTARRVGAGSVCGWCGKHRPFTPRCGPSSHGRAFFVAQRHHPVLRIALPNKGRLADDARELFRDAGVDVRARDERALTSTLGDLFEAIFVRAQDIPEFVADGAADAGITGADLIAESDRALCTLADLEFGKCRLA